MERIHTFFKKGKPSFIIKNQVFDFTDIEKARGKMTGALPQKTIKITHIERKGKYKLC
tara:strand:+ start:231 stop:404 length:174 start_codon:yes stop_codon:yes gene_type:complete